MVGGQAPARSTLKGECTLLAAPPPTQPQPTLPTVRNNNSSHYRDAHTPSTVGARSETFTTAAPLCSGGGRRVHDRLGFSTWRGWTSGCRRWQPQPQPGPSGERPSCSPPRSWRARWRHAQTCSICEIHTNTRQTLGIRGDGAPTRFTPPPLPVLDGNVDTWMVTVIDTPLVG